MRRKDPSFPKEREAQARKRALATLARMRRTKMTLTVAARQENVDPRTVKKYFGPELSRPGGGGVIRVSKTDRRSRQMLVPTSRGNARTTVRGSEEASLLGRYMSAVGQFVDSGDTDQLDEFKGQSVGGHRLITDPETLTVLAQAGALQLDEIYAMPESFS